MVPLLTPEQVAEIFSVPVATLYKWRERGYGPAGLKVGKYLRYEPAAVEAFIASQRAGDAENGTSRSQTT